MNPRYVTVRTVEEVVIKVPKLGTPDWQGKIAGLKPMKGFVTNDQVVVEDYYRFGQWFSKDKVVLNKCFHGLKDGDIGRKKVFTVEVIEKTTQNEVYTMINYYRQPDDVRATVDMKIVCDAPIGDGILENEVLHTKEKIYFIPRQVRKLVEV